jgi:hypothetical protein
VGVLRRLCGGSTGAELGNKHMIKCIEQIIILQLGRNLAIYLLGSPLKDYHNFNLFDLI